jgi:TPR repeat protein
LGFAYLRGQTVARDPAQMEKWFRAAAAQGHAPAQFALGGIYAKGVGVIADAVEALQWYLLAAGNGDTRAEPAATALKATMTASQITAAERRAQAFTPR